MGCVHELPKTHSYRLKDGRKGNQSKESEQRGLWVVGYGAEPAVAWARDFRTLAGSTP